MDGIIKWFDPAKRYGFLQPLVGRPDTTPDLFFHISAVQGARCLPEGARVSFRVVDGRDGRRQAADVRLKEARLPREHVLAVRES